MIRVCDCCNADEPIQKVYTLLKRRCSSDQHDILLCLDCIKIKLNEQKIYDKQIDDSIIRLYYLCKCCSRNDKLNKILKKQVN